MRSLLDTLRAHRDRILPAGSLRSRVVRGTFWAFAGTALAQGLALVASVVVARLLGRVGFGELNMIRTTVGMFGVFAGLGLGLTATKHVAEFRDSNPGRAGRIIGLSNAVAICSGGLLSLAVFLLAPWLSGRAIDAPHLAPELRVASALLLLGALNGVQRGALAGFEAFKTIAVLSLLQGLLHLPLMLIGVHLWGVRGAVGALVAAAAIAWLLNHTALRIVARRAGVVLSLRRARAELPVLWRFSLPAVMSGALVGPVTWAVQAILANQPNGYAELGLFAAASRLMGVLFLVGGPVGAVLLPMLCSREGGASDRFKRANVILSWALGAFPAIVLIAFPELMGILFGPEYAGTQFSRTVVVVMGYSCVRMYKEGLGRVLAARSMLWWGLLSNGFWAAALLICAFGMAEWGALGLAASFAAAYVLNAIVFMPLYVLKGLVPRGTMVSAEAALVWAVIGAMSALTLSGAPLALRLGALPVGAGLLVLAFGRIYGPERTPRWRELLRAGRHFLGYPSG